MNKQELIEKLKIIDGGYGSRYYIAISDVFELLEQLDEPQPIKLKDIIARIKSLDVGIQEVWLNKILKELGSDYGSLKYRAGYEQGKFDSTMEHEKVTVPQFVADWIEDCKTKGKSLLKSLLYTPGKVNSWVDDPDNQETFALAWINGYEVEQEKRYTVKLKNTDDYLVKTAANSYRFYNNIYTQNRKHTKEEIEKSGFGWVFDCEGIEVEKVEE
ncbi:DUF1642 domain-containing protein [Streptococcus sp. S5]|uniref:DUF1642 domain-containing protein n=1 Tax=Streptococcus lingualis TaxID=3098076 RepID=A0ABZ0SV65_9STRE|nr:DUF1642 domain-containing protein [Streptococcus sp. S5]WPS47582.1 DUF1642 domain-containing protein [Streptococcus sp. S5]